MTPETLSLVQHVNALVRKYHGLERAADFLGVSANNLLRIRSGRCPNPRVSTLKKLGLRVVYVKEEA